jgi:hypothetical protein
VFVWHAPGAIFGKVIDDRGEPVASAQLQLIRVAVEGGRKRTRTAAWANADDLGNYRFQQLFAGTYYLAVSAEPWYNSFQRIPAFQTAATSSVYAAAYYPNTTDPRGAAPIAVKSGVEVEANFTLRTVPCTNVHLSCTGSERCSGTVYFYADGIDGVETLVKQTYAAVHTEMPGQPAQMIGGVPAGRYILRFSGSGQSMHKVVDIGGTETTINLTPEAAAKITGALAFGNPAVKPGRAVYVRLVNEETTATFLRAVEADGSFSFPSVVPARYRAYIAGADGYFISSLAAEGAEVRDGVIDVGEGASVRLHIIASDETGRLKGFVKEGDRPVPAVFVVLAPVKNSDDSSAYRLFQTDSDGSFDFENLRAGDYYLLRVESAQIEYSNPAVIRPYLAGAKPVHIEAHRTAEQDLVIDAASPAIP